MAQGGCARTTRDGDAPAPHPCPGFPLSRERRLGEWVPTGAAGGGGGGSRLRGTALRQAQGERFPKRAYRVWESGMRTVGGRVAKPGACLVKGLHRNDACGRPPSCAFRTGFDRLRVNGIANRPYDGVWGVRSARKSVVGGGGSAPAPGPAPLDSCLRRNDAGGCRIDECCWWRRGRPAVARRPPACAGMTSGGGPSTGSGRTDSRMAPTTGWGEVGWRRGFGSRQGNEQCSAPLGSRVLA